MIRRALLMTLAAMIAARSAAAEPAAVEQRTSSLSWVRLPGAESCIGTRALAEAVEARLGRTVVVSAAAADISIEGRVERAEDGEAQRWRATVVASEPSGDILGERTLESEEEACAALDETLALVIAVMIDPAAALPERGSDEVEPEPDPPPEPPETELDEPAVEPPPEEPEPASPEPTQGLRVDLIARYVVAVGTLPGVPMGPGASMILDPVGFWPLEVEITALLGARAEDEVGAASFVQLRGGLFVCAPWEPGPLRLHGCAGVVAGATRAAGSGFDRALETWSPLLDGAARIRLLYNPLSWLVLEAEASLLVPILRDRVTYRDGAGEEQLLFEPAPVGGAFDVGVGVLFE